jgi:hypothetical protein
METVRISEVAAMFVIQLMLLNRIMTNFRSFTNRKYVCLAKYISSFRFDRDNQCTNTQVAKLCVETINIIANSIRSEYILLKFYTQKWIIELFNY